MGKVIMNKKRANNSNNDGTFSIVRPDGEVLAQFSTEDPTGSDSTQQWLQMGLDLKRRRFSLTGEVNENMSEFVLRAITTLNDINHDPITIHLQTYGGGVYEGFAIYDVLRASVSPITVIASGKIASMGIVIFLAGTERIASPNTRFTESLKGHFEDLITSTKDDIQTYDDNIAKAERDILSLKKYKESAEANIKYLESILGTKEVTSKAKPVKT